MDSDGCTTEIHHFEQQRLLFTAAITINGRASASQCERKPGEHRRLFSGRLFAARAHFNHESMHISHEMDRNSGEKQLKRIRLSRMLEQKPLNGSGGYL